MEILLQLEHTTFTLSPAQISLHINNSHPARFCNDDLTPDRLIENAVTLNTQIERLENVDGDSTGHSQAQQAA